MTRLRKYAAGVIFAAATVAAAAANSPKYIFYFIGDGMGMGHVLSAQTYNRVVLGHSEPLLMMQFPATGVATTYSATGPVTDSAAAGTALATGHKTLNGMLGQTPDSATVESIAARLFRRGYGVGIVTSVYPDDATPGAFFAHQPTRRNTFEIGIEAAKCGYEFIAGSNLRSVKTKDGRSTGLTEAFAQYGVDYVRGAQAAQESTSRRIFMVNTDSLNISNIGYTIDSLQNTLTLPVMTQTCLDHLLKWTPDSFFMMVEGGNIDHAAHGNDGGAVIKEIINFNQAIEIAHRFYLAHPNETLIVVTADHDTGGMAIGNSHVGYDMQPQYFDFQKVSKDRFADLCRVILRSRAIFTWDDMRQMLTDKLGFWTHVPLNEAQTRTLEEKFTKTFELRNSDDQKTLYSNFDEFTAAVFKVLNDIAGVGWIAGSHTGGYVPVYAIGVDAHLFAGIHDNTDIPAIMARAAGLDR